MNSNTERRERMLNFVWNTWKCWQNETDDEILHVFVQVLWTSFEVDFHSFPWEIVFGVISGNYSLPRRANARNVSFESLYGGFILLYSPPTQHHSFFRNLTLWSVIYVFRFTKM